MREFWPFRWACAVPALNAAADFFSMQAEFCHFGHETARRLRGMAAGMREVRSQSLAVCV